jgi:hypothetical protein
MNIPNISSQDIRQMRKYLYYRFNQEIKDPDILEMIKFKISIYLGEIELFTQEQMSKDFWEEENARV